MRGLLSRTETSFDRVLLIESGPRELAESALNRLYSENPTRLDLLTCYDTAPEAFDPGLGALYSVHDAEAVANRRGFAEKLARHPYTAVAVLAVDSPVLAKWKWVILLRTRAKVVTIDKHADLLPLGFAHAKAMAESLLDKLNRAVALRFLQLLLTPFAIAYLLLFTVVVHLRRWFRARRAAS